MEWKVQVRLEWNGIPSRIPEWKVNGMRYEWNGSEWKVWNEGMNGRWNGMANERRMAHASYANMAALTGKPVKKKAELD